MYISSGRAADAATPRPSPQRGARAVRLVGANVLMLGTVSMVTDVSDRRLGPVLLVCVLALHGAFHAATDGVLMAAAGPLLPDELRTSGVAVLQTGQAVARLLSSVAVGALWTIWGVSVAVGAAAVALGLMLALAVPLLGGAPPRRAHVG